MASAAITAAALVVLADVRNGAVDIGVGAVLVIALVVFARAAIGLASESPGRRR